MIKNKFILLTFNKNKNKYVPKTSKNKSTENDFDQIDKIN